MEEHFTETGTSHKEVVTRIRMKYGDRAKIMFYKNVRIGGFLGLFTKDGVEYTGYITDTPAANRKSQDEQNKKEILSMTQKGGTIDQVLKEVQELKDHMSQGMIKGEARDLHPSLEQIKTLLLENDFSRQYTDDMINRLKREFSLEDLENFSLLEEAVMEWIGESIELHHETPPAS